MKLYGTELKFYPTYEENYEEKKQEKIVKEQEEKFKIDTSDPQMKNAKYIAVMQLKKELIELTDEATASKYARIGCDNIDDLQKVIDNMKIEIEYRKLFKKFTTEQDTVQNKLKAIEFFKSL